MGRSRQCLPSPRGACQTVIYGLVTYRLLRFSGQQQQAQYQDGDDAEPPRNAARAYHYCPRDCARRPVFARRQPTRWTRPPPPPVRRFAFSLTLRLAPAVTAALASLTAPGRTTENKYIRPLVDTACVGRDCRRFWSRKTNRRETADREKSNYPFGPSLLRHAPRGEHRDRCYCADLGRARTIGGGGGGDRVIGRHGAVGVRNGGRYGENRKRPRKI